MVVLQKLVSKEYIILGGRLHLELRAMMVSVIIPTYNERENVEELIVRLSNSLSRFNYEVVVVDDNSPDGTADVAEELSKKYPVRVIRRPGKLGLASAIVDGIKACRGDVVIIMDADLQHPPEVVPKLIEEVMRGNDLVIASRYVKGGSISGWGVTRRLISKTAVLLARVLIPSTRRVKDPVSGFFAVRRDAISDLLNKLNPRGFKILLEVLARGNFTKISEVPYEFRVRFRGRSKLGINEIINYGLLLLTLTPYLRIAKFMVVGGVGTVVNLSTLYLLKYVFNLPHIVSSALAIEVSIVNNYTLHDLWTFKDRRSGRWVGRLIKFHGSTAIAVSIQYTASQILHYILGFESIIAQFTGILLGFIANYTLSSQYIWGSKKV